MKTKIAMSRIVTRRELRRRVSCSVLRACVLLVGASFIGGCSKSEELPSSRPATSSRAVAFVNESASLTLTYKRTGGELVEFPASIKVFHVAGYQNKEVTAEGLLYVLFEFSNTGKYPTPRLFHDKAVLKEEKG